jgi:quinol monooxygenase YgiN
MDVTVIATFACAVVAAAGTGVLVGRCIRAPRMDIIVWACAVSALAVSLGAQALGAHNGYSSATFRTVQIGAQLIAPLWIAWGMVEFAGRSVASRFGAKLVVAALTVIGAVVLITDPLGSTPFSKTWPIGSDHYQIIPKYVLDFVSAVTVFTVLVTLVVALLRLRRDPGWRRPLLGLAAAGVAAVAILGLRLNLHADLAYPALCAACCLLVTYAGLVAVKVRLDVLHGDFAGPGEIEEPAGWGAREAATPSEEFATDGAYGSAQPRRMDNGAGQRFGDEDWYRLDRRNQPNGGYPPGAGYQQDGGHGMNGLENGDRGYPPGDEADGPSDGDRTGVWQPRTLGRAGGLGAAAGMAAGARGGGNGAQPGGEPEDKAATQRLFGLIAIYTLAEGKDAEFDALAERLVEQVRASEPDALVYAVHSVPNAPMQRIFYEVYRDQTAYEEHKRHSYIKRFDVERAPFVLATNVIELGTQQAKLSPLPGLSQMFGHSAAD